jgi:Peptidase family M1 domain
MRRFGALIVAILLFAGLVAAEVPMRPAAPATAGDVSSGPVTAPAPTLVPVAPLARRPQRLASYDITASLDGKKHEITGSLKLTWHNASDKPATKLLFHLYLNAFKNETTHWFAEALRHRLDQYVGKSDWGSITVRELKVAGVAAKRTQLVSDGTVLRVVPAQPVAGASTVEITMSFHVVLPRVRARTGFVGDFHLVAQWFPKIGVREPDGTWRCHPFYMTSEFYADFGSYRVTLDVPKGFGVAATGRRIGKKTVKGGRHRVTYGADDVHDFAWTTGPDLGRMKRSVGRVKLQAVHFGEPAQKVRHHLDVTQRSLALLQKWLGPYPYDTLTVVLVPKDAESAGGMEYPTLFTSGVHHPPFLERAVALHTTVHELVHQYFYGLLASNEFAEPWLDEGLTSYVTGLVLDELYGADRSMGQVGSLKLGYFSYLRLGMRLMPDWDPARQQANRFAEPQSYFLNVYGRSALALRTLERQIGWPRMRKLLRDYVDRHRFTHPRGVDFFRTVDAHVTRKSIRQFTRAAIESSGVLDYEVARVYAIGLRKPRGRYDTSFDKRRRNLINIKGYENRVLLHRKGELRLPIEVELRFAGGSKKRVRWDGQNRWHWITVHHERPIRSAEIDPHRTLALERTVLNNGLRTDKDTRPARRMAGRVLGALQILMQVVGF